jgi:oligoendopeptidase F
MTNFNQLPKTPADIEKWVWADYAPYYQELEAAALTPSNVDEWLKRWTKVYNCIDELRARLSIATSLNTTDKEAEQRMQQFFTELNPPAKAADNTLKEKLLTSGLQPAGMEIPLRDMRADAEIFRAENMPLIAEEEKLSNQYDQVAGAQTVQWEGQELTVTQLQPIYQSSDRARREKAWRMAADRQMADRQTINALWRQYMPLRLKKAHNAGMSDYRSYCWKERHRFEYTPDDCRRFHDAIEQVVVPAVVRINERRRKNLGLDSLKPWDLKVDPLGRAPLRPFKDASVLKERSSTIFHNVDPQLGEYFDILQREDLLDLDNRKNKAPGAYCTSLEVTRRPFIFVNAVGLHNDVQTTLHESGHAFHVFEAAALPYFCQVQPPMEFAEVASMSMEYLAAPYLTAEHGGFYTPAQAAMARIEHIEDSILFWPYMAVVDAFQHWVYENHAAASDPLNCDAEWARQWARFMKGMDYSGLEDWVATGWQRKLHIHLIPFYYIEYGLAQLGAVQVWGNALKDQAKAVADYRHALSLGGTATLPQLFHAAGAKLAFDAATLGEAVALMERVIADLEQV